jgi:hypothetical protein
MSGTPLSQGLLTRRTAGTIVLAAGAVVTLQTTRLPGGLPWTLWYILDSVTNTNRFGSGLPAGVPPVETAPFAYSKSLGLASNVYFPTFANRWEDPATNPIPITVEFAVLEWQPSA